jgi:hypothetical protein
MRVGTLTKINQNTNVVGLKDVDQVIAVMGQPEDYIIEEITIPQSYSGAAPKTKIIPTLMIRVFCWTRSPF